jgi:PAS domain S-box-containing protein
MSRFASLRARVAEELRDFQRPLVDISEDSFLRPLFLQRYLGILGLAVGALLVGLFSDFPLVVPVLILLVGITTNALAHLEAQRSGQAPIWMHFADMVAVLLFPAVVPSTAIPAIFVMLTIVSLAASVSGRAPAIVVSLLGTVGLVAITPFEPIDRPWLMIGGYTVTALMIAVTVGELSAVESRVRRRLDTVVDNLDAILWVRDPVTGRFTFVNQRASSMLGWPEDEWLAEGFWAANLHPADRDATLEAVGRSVALGIDHEVSYRFRAADGRWVDLHDRVTVTVDSAGTPTALQGMSIDVTDRVEIEHRVNQYADIVDRIDQALLVLRLEGDGEPGGPAPCCACALRTRPPSAWSAATCTR